MPNFTEGTWIWKDGDFIPWADARLHLLSTAVQFGSSVFEGIRCFETPRGPAIFRLKEHMRRLLESARIYRMEVRFTADEIAAACVATVARNGLSECYMRPMVLRGYGAPSMNGVGSPIEVFIPAWPWGTYLGEDAIENGIDTCVASWHRAAPNTFPSAAKSAGNYNSAQLMKFEAMANGYAEAIALGTEGLVSEGTGQNLFLVRDGTLITPPLDGTNLTGITRDAVLRLAQAAGIPALVQQVPRETLYTADELFFTGTASDITPIRSVDRIPIGNRRPGPITRDLQKRYLDVTHGRVPDTFGWLTPVPQEVLATV